MRQTEPVYRAKSSSFFDQQQAAAAIRDSKKAGDFPAARPNRQKGIVGVL
jgi:hypothetical protein